MKKIQTGIPKAQEVKNPVVKKLVQESKQRQKQLDNKADVQKQRTSNKLPVDFTQPIKVVSFNPSLAKDGTVEKAVLTAKLFLTKKENVIAADGKHAQQNFIEGDYLYRAGRKMKDNELQIDMYDLLLGKDFYRAHVEFGKIAVEKINALNKKANFQAVKDTRRLKREENKTTKDRKKK